MTTKEINNMFEVTVLLLLFQTPPSPLLLIITDNCKMILKLE